MNNTQIRATARRSFLRRALAGGVVTGTTLSALGAHMALAQGEQPGGIGWDGERPHGRRSDYGDLQPARDQNGDRILALPRDFSYVTFSKTGESFGRGMTCTIWGPWERGPL